MPGHVEALLAAAVFAAIFLLSERFQIHRAGWRRAGVSVAAGGSISFVFVHLLPELSEAGGAFVEAAGGRGIPFAELRIYLAAMAGFIFFLGLENMVVSSRRRSDVAGVKHEHSRTLSLVHIGSFAVYVWLVSYLMVRGVGEAAMPIMLYGLAMGLHFLSIGHGLLREHPRRYLRPGRQILAASALAGWGCGMLTEFSEPIVLMLLGFVSGGVIMNSIVAELPSEKEGRFCPFVFGASGYTCLLLLL